MKIKKVYTLRITYSLFNAVREGVEPSCRDSVSNKVARELVVHPYYQPISLSAPSGLEGVSANFTT